MRIISSCQDDVHESTTTQLNTRSAASFLDKFTAVDPNLSVSEPDTVDVYLLLLLGEVVYVGRTVQLATRIQAHRIGNSTTEQKSFDQVFKLSIPRSLGPACEGALMRHFLPRYVDRVEVDDSRDREIIEGLGLAFLPGGKARLVAHRAARRKARRRRALRSLRPQLVDSIWAAHGGLL